MKQGKGQVLILLVKLLELKMKQRRSKIVLIILFFIILVGIIVTIYLVVNKPNINGEGLTREILIDAIDSDTRERLITNFTLKSNDTILSYGVTRIDSLVKAVIPQNSIVKIIPSPLENYYAFTWGTLVIGSLRVPAIFERPGINPGLELSTILIPMALIGVVNYLASHFYLHLDKKHAFVVGLVMAIFTAPWLIVAFVLLVGNW